MDANIWNDSIFLNYTYKKSASNELININDNL